MRKTNIIMMILLFLFFHTGCGSFAQQGTEVHVTTVPETGITNQAEKKEGIEVTGTTPELQDTEQAGDGYEESPEPDKEDLIVENIEIIVGNAVYQARLYDNKAAQALAEQLPLTITMRELNGNEKYYYLSDSLPTDASVPASIRTGDLMLYGSDCLVLFYESFSTSYRYTPLGYVENPEGLAGALGSRNVEVIFQVAE